MRDGSRFLWKNWDRVRRQLSVSHRHNLPGHRLSTAEDTRRHRRGCDRFVRVVNIIDVQYVRNIGYVPHVGYVDDVQINTAVAVPGKKRLSRPQREPTYQADANADREVRASEKCYQCRHINPHYNHRWRDPSPSRSD